ncbi:MAG: CHAD domain-containing protein [Bacteroidota bacterium]
MKTVRSYTISTGVSPHPLIEILEKRWNRFRKELKKAQKSYSERSVHDVRVASRRLLSALDVIESWTQVKKIKTARKELKQILKTFSSVRDAHVQQIVLRDLARTTPAVRRLIDHLQTQEKKRIRRSVKRIRSLKPTATRKLMKGIRQWSGLIAFAGAANLNGNLAALARRSLAAQFIKVESLCRAINRRNLQILHQMRIAFKKYRYTAEFLRPFLPRGADQLLKRMHDYQTVLGDIHDLEVLIATTREFAGKLRRSAPKTVRLGSTLRLLSQRKRELVSDAIRRKDEIHQLWPFEKPASPAETVQPLPKEVQ